MTCPSRARIGRECEFMMRLATSSPKRGADPGISRPILEHQRQPSLTGLQVADREVRSPFETGWTGKGVGGYAQCQEGTPALQKGRGQARKPSRASCACKIGVERIRGESHLRDQSSREPVPPLLLIAPTILPSLREAAEPHFGFPTAKSPLYSLRRLHHDGRYREE